MNEAHVLAVFEKAGALLEGHFELASGRHSARYLQCALVLQEPATAEVLCRALAEPWRDRGIDVVVGPATGGIILAHELARALGTRSVFMERKDGPMALRRGFRIAADEKVLIAEDVMTTGGSVAEIVEELERRQAESAGVACLVDRGGAERFAALGGRALLKLDIPTHDPAECPLCAAGKPIDKPGSQKLSAGPPVGPETF